MNYGKVYDRERIREFGEKGKLTWGKLVRIYGIFEARYELDRLVELDQVVKPDLERPMLYENSICYNKEVWNKYYNTKINWIGLI